jgi:hypothetical protein
MAKNSSQRARYVSFRVGATPITGIDDQIGKHIQTFFEGGWVSTKQVPAVPGGGFPAKITLAINIRDLKSRDAASQLLTSPRGRASLQRRPLHFNLSEGNTLLSIIFEVPRVFIVSPIQLVPFQ